MRKHYAVGHAAGGGLPILPRIAGPVSGAAIASSAFAATARPEASLIRRIVWLTALHVALGLLMHRVPAVATGHAALTITVGTFLALRGRPDRVVYAAAYIAGSEVLWRMCRAAVLWESGKYAVLWIFGIALIRLCRPRLRALPVLYFLLLLPSVALAPYELLSEEARGQISFNLSGPAALAVSVCFLSQIRLGRSEWLNTVIALAGPLAAIATIALYNTVTATTLSFTLNSNGITSGGFGPNQVSTVLGLGVFLAFFAGVEPGRPILLRWTMLAIAIALATQSAMTFSRGGLYSAGVAIIVGSWYLQREPRARIALVLAAGALSVMAAFVILPRLDRFTGGKVVSRFESVNTTGRAELAHEDLRDFFAHPVGGLGPGGRRDTAHTEFTRLLADHGLLGVGALLVLLAMVFQAMQAARTVQERALVAALFAWSFVTMAHMAMRIVAPSLVFGLAFAIPARRHMRAATPGPSARSRLPRHLGAQD